MAGDPEKSAALRRQATERLSRKTTSVRVPDSNAETERLLHELQVHQIELEMQNEELERSHAAVDSLLQHYTELFDFAPIGYVRLTEDGMIREVNLAAAKLIGLERARLTGARFRQFIAPMAHAAFDSFLTELSREEVSHSCDVTLLRESLPPATVMLSATRFSSDGQSLVAITDMTESRRADEALRLRDRAMQAVTQGILITDPNRLDNPIVYASPGFERLTGYRAADVLGRNCRFLQGPETVANQVLQVREAIRAQRACKVEIINYRCDGSPFWNELSITPVHDGLGKVVNFVGVLSDVTQRRALEEQHRESQKMEGIGRLAGGLAHDFNNLLTVSNGYCDLLLEDLMPVGQHRMMFDQIRKSGDRAAGLTRQLLAFSRNQLLLPQSLQLNKLVAELDKLLKPLIGEDIDIVTVLAPDLRPVWADPGQIEQILMNLALNARDAMPQGGRLTLETKSVARDQTGANEPPDEHPTLFVCLTVTDSGFGMSPEVQARVFEPFFTTKGPGKGTGLGLATVYGIVKQSGGHIEVHSEVGVGTTFKLYLPTTSQSGTYVASQSETTAMAPGTELILLVEDEPALLELNRRILTGCGYTVLAASDGDEAARIADLNLEQIDLLVTDAVMPGISGSQLAELLRARHPRLRVLLVSGYTDDEVVRHGLLHGQVDLLQKPYSPAVFARKVRDTLDAK